MPQCPVCQVRYVRGKTEFCPVCGWNVQSLTLLTGLMPEVTEREAVRLKWAKALWNNLQSQREKFHQLQLQRDESVTQIEHLQNQLAQVSQENIALTEKLHQPHRTIAPLPADLQPIGEQVYQEQPISLELPKRESVSPPADISRAEIAELGIAESEWGQSAADESEALEAEAVNDVTLEVRPLEPVSNTDIQSPLLQPTSQVLVPAQLLSMDESRSFSAFILPSIEPSEPAEFSTQRASTISALPLRQIAAQEWIQEFGFDVATLHPQGLERHSHKAFCFHETLEMGVNLEMVLVPGGTFQMGSPDSEDERDSSESPQHEVTIAPFCLGRFPITQLQWQSIATLPKIKRSLSPYPSNFENDDHPVEMVPWYDTVEFCARLSEKTGRLYRLPSEAEWEYACRAGTTTPFHFGDTLLPELANYDGNYTYGKGLQGLYRQETTAVEFFQLANAFGLSDMHGNVWEWCADPWHENYQNAPSDGSVWHSDEEVVYQVLRGGAWYCLPGLCRSAQRHWNQPDGIGSGIGFRVACELPLALKD